MDGYYRFPTVHSTRVLFISEDDLWETDLGGGPSRRLTSGVGEVQAPALSPTGARVAFVATEEGVPDLYVMDAHGGPLTRLTFDGMAGEVVGWSRDGTRILLTSSREEPHRRQHIFSVPAAGGQPRRVPIGEAVWFGRQVDGDGRVLGRHRTDLARWKRYRGGLAGEIWVDLDGEDDWTQILSEVDAGLTRPFWLEGRIWFVSDLDDHANLYSCTPTGDDLTRHTDHTGFSVRHPQTDGHTIVYTVGGELWRYDLRSGAASQIALEYASPRTQVHRKFVDAAEFLEEFALHPKGHSLTVTSRGKLYNFGLWEGAVRQTGAEQGVRYRLPCYTEGGDAIVVLSDEGGAEHIEIHDASGGARRVVECDADLGRAIDMQLSPKGDCLALANHRYQLLVVELETGAVTEVARSDYQRIEDFDWSHDGRWLAFAVFETQQISKVKLTCLEDGETFDVSTGEFRDTSPVFDPKGRYLYFVSYREFNPVYGNLLFELSLNRGQRLCLVTLTEDEESPFIDEPHALDDTDGEDDDDGEDEKTSSSSSSGDGDEDEDDGEETRDETKDEELLEVDTDGLTTRVLSFPMRESRYERLAATPNRLYFLSSPPRGALSRGGDEGPATLAYWSLKSRKRKRFHGEVETYTLGPDRKTIALWVDDAMRVVSATGGSPEDEDDGDDRPCRETGWIDLERVSVEVEPRAEWRQMLREVWRLMREQFWREDMSGVDWEAVWARYSPLVERVGSRAEFSDLVWTMQGELGTSHAYEIGGDYREPPEYSVGYLGADTVWDPKWRHEVEDGMTYEGGYRIRHIVRGDDWKPKTGSPLARPGLSVREGDVILAINGKRVDATHSVERRLVNEAGHEVEIKLFDADAEAIETITVRALSSDSGLRYREWVTTRRRAVHEATDGRVGYIHIPDMGPRGYAEFHRSYTAEVHRDGLIVDVRFNGGGHVSPLILEKLSRRTIGFDLQRHGRPVAYPPEGPRGPMVALTNEYAGSDGDIFSHSFKLFGLGPLLGKRTWGGVIGIWPRHQLVDGSVTTQPEFSFWFVDVGFGLENHGAEPDEVVPSPPHAEADGEDVQLDAAISKALQLLEGADPGPPEQWGVWPDLAPSDDLS